MNEADRLADELLDLLLASGRAWSGQELARQTGRDVATISKALASLEADGCRVERHPLHGVRLVESGMGCWRDYVEHRQTGGIGQRVLAYRQTGSTQQVARQLVEGAADPMQHHGTVIVADHQTSGRGRLGRSWVADPGRSLLVTVIADRSGRTDDHLMLAATCAVVWALESCDGASVGIRWPNDLMLSGAKVAGILLESIAADRRSDHGRAAGTVLIGIGINVQPLPQDIADRLDQPVTCLADHRIHVDRLVLLHRLCEHLTCALDSAGVDELVQTWRERSVLSGQRITVMHDGRKLAGRVIDIDPADGLLLEIERGPSVALPAQTTRLLLHGDGLD